MKKLFLVMASFVLALSFWACNGETTTATTATTTTTTQAPGTTTTTTTGTTTAATGISFSGVEDKTVNWGVIFDPLEGVTATDSEEGDLTSAITVTGTVDTFRAQNYTITYTVQNSEEEELSVDRTITVPFPTFEDFVNVTENEDVVEEYTAGNNLDLALSGDSATTGVPGWGSWGSGGSYVCEDGVISMTTSMSYFQVSNSHNEFNIGQKYIVLFDVKGAADHVNPNVEFTFRAIVGSEESGWDDHHIQYFNTDITTQWQTFAFLFTAKYNTENVLLFASENKANTLSFKNIKIFELFPKPAAVISGYEDLDVAWDSEVDLLDGVTATDEVDGDITSSIEVIGSIDTYYPGEYRIQYKVVNSQEIETLVTRIVTVGQPSMAEILDMADDETSYPYTGNNLDLSQNGLSTDTEGVPGWGSWGMGGPFGITDGVLTFDTLVNYYQVSNSNNTLNLDQAYIVLFEAKADAEQAAPAVFRAIVGSEEDGWDDYHIQYFETNVGLEYQQFGFMFRAQYATSNVFLFATEGLENSFSVRNIEVIELNFTGAPTFLGHTPASIGWNSDFDPLEGVTATDVTDGDLTSSITVTGTVDTFVPGEYSLTYSVTNSQSVTKTVERTITVNEPTFAELIAFAATEDVSEYTGGVNLDLTQNGTTAEGGTLPGWTFWGLNGTNSVTDGVLTMQVATDYWQAANGGHVFNVGQNYIVTFQVKATAEHVAPAEFRVIVGSEESGWDDFHIQYFDTTVNLEYQTFAFMFEAEYNTANVLLFAASGLANTFSIKDINVYEVYPLAEPTLAGLDPLVVDWNSTLDLVTGVTALDEVDGDLTSSIEILDVIDTFHPGVYQVRYLVENSLGLVATGTRSVTVNQPTLAQMLTEVAESDSYEYQGNNLDLSQNGLSTDPEGVPAWGSWGIGGPFGIADGVLSFDTDTFYYQVSNANNNFILGQAYVVLFEIKADAPQAAPAVFRTIVGSEESGWDDFHIQYFDTEVSTTYQQFGFMFTAEYQTKNVLLFAFEGLANKFYIQNIQIVELNANPAPLFAGHTPLTVPWNSEADLLAGVTATDDVDGDLTSSIVVSGSVDKYVPGDYTVTYSVTNSENKTATVTRTVTVSEPTMAELITASQNTDVEPYVGYNLDLTLDGSTASGGVPGWSAWGPGLPGINTVADNQLTIQTDVDYWQAANNFNTFHVGQQYIVTFELKADVVQSGTAVMRAIIGSEENGWHDFHIQYFESQPYSAEFQTYAFIFTSQYATKNVLLFAFEHLANTFTIRNITISEVDPEKTATVAGVTDLSVPWGTTVDLVTGVTAADETDGDLTSEISVVGTVDSMVPGTYNVYYEVTNSLGVTSTFRRIVTVPSPTQSDIINLSNDETKTTPHVGYNLDLTVNGTTDGGGTVPGWGSWGLGGPYSVQDGVLTINNTGTYFDVSNGNNTFIENSLYIVTFQVRADQVHTGSFRALIGSNEPGWDEYHAQVFENQVNTEWQTFAFIFRAKYDTMNVLIFNSDLFANVFYIKDIHIVSVD